MPAKSSSSAARNKSGGAASPTAASAASAASAARAASAASAPSAPSAAAAPTAAAAAGNSVPQGGTQEVTNYVQQLLQQMQARFEDLSKNIITRIDEVNGRVDELEQSIEGLMQQSGVEGGDTPAARPKK
ncbi:Heat shock factor binding protein 1, putative [Leishmania lindenbergi]|uniref:Heat shock factor binding protein 1 n=1 Tax=Leishmania lindenbergi TaxID=651832 RepID=A0AAW2ZUV3_9TRYP